MRKYRDINNTVVVSSSIPYSVVQHLCLIGLIISICIAGGGAAEPVGNGMSLSGGGQAAVTKHIPQTNTSDVADTRVDVAVDGTHVASGGTVTTTDDPRISFVANTSSRISLIALRVDGRTYRSYTPNSTKYSQAVTLDVQPGPHDIELVTKTTTRVHEYRLTVTEDSVAPTMAFTKPIDSSGASLEGSYDVDSSQVTIAGTVADRSGVEKVTLEHTYRYTRAGDGEQGREQTVIHNPNGSVSWSVDLIPPQETSTETTNRIEVRLYDQFGQIRQYEFNLTVRDDAPPEVTITDLTALHKTAEVRVDFSVTDAAGIRSVKVSNADVPNVGRNRLLSLDPEAQPVEAEFTHTVPVDEGSPSVTLVATDASGQEQVISRELNYSALITPITRIETRETRFVDDTRVSMVGNVSEGKIARVRVETVAPNGTVLDIQTAHSGAVVSRVALNETLHAETDVYPVRVRVRTLDATGAEHLESVTLSQPAAGRTLPANTSQESPRRLETSANQSNSTTTETPVDSSDGIISQWLPESLTLAQDSVGESGLGEVALVVVTLLVGMLLIIRY